MRTLLIDNYDSFTYNLYQLISQVNGVEPVVVRNDEVAELDLAGFDNIVISPGPGRPDIARDFGISAGLIANSELPLLGVCLGHQGIVIAAGGAVTGAPRARHGYPDRITHDGRELFADVPQDFTAVRYHSLCAARPLPETLEVTATAPDGVIMGIRHRDRPQWGVQFHPESISSEYGELLLRNFADLTRAHQSRTGGQRDAFARMPGGFESLDPRAGSTQHATSRSAPHQSLGSGPGLDTDIGTGTGTATDTGTITSTATGTNTATATNIGTDTSTDTCTGTEDAPKHAPVISRASESGSGSSFVSARARSPRAENGCAHIPSARIHYRVEQIVLDRAVDTEAVFDRLYRASPTAFWLDSEHVEPGLDRFSFLGDASGPLAETVRYRVGSGVVEVASAAGTRMVPGGVLDYLSGELRRRRIEFPDVPFDFVGGYVGYLGYEMKADCGAEVAHRAPTPDAQWLFADRLIVVDHEAGRTYLLALAESTADSPAAESNSHATAPDSQATTSDSRATAPPSRTTPVESPTTAREAHTAPSGSPAATREAHTTPSGSPAAMREADTTPSGHPAAARETHTTPSESPAEAREARTTQCGSPAAALDSIAAARDWLGSTRTILEGLPTWANPPDLELHTDEGMVAPLLTRGRERYLADVEACQAQLVAGESYEVCITDSAYLPADGDGLSVYRTLRRCNPAPYAAFLRFEGLEVASSSPERFLKLDRARTVESKPIKGTAPRGHTPAEDERLARELALDPKTRAENLMIVDLLRNDLGRVCEIGSVHVPKLMAVETYTTLHQLVSTVRGTLRPHLDVIDVLRACFPGGSMTGAPKLRTMEIIDGLETEARGIYSGTIGFLGLGGTADLNIVIRTAVRHNGSWRVGAGGAIVLDSDPNAEYQEMLWKAATALRALPGLAVPPKTPLPSA